MSNEEFDVQQGNITPSEPFLVRFARRPAPPGPGPRPSPRPEPGTIVTDVDRETTDDC